MLVAEGKLTRPPGLCQKQDRHEQQKQLSSAFCTVLAEGNTIPLGPNQGLSKGRANITQQAASRSLACGVMLAAECMTVTKAPLRQQHSKSRTAHLNYCYAGMLMAAGGRDGVPSSGQE